MKILFASTIVLLFVLLIAPDLISQQERLVEKYSKLSIAIQDKSDIRVLQRMGFDMEGTKLNDQSLEIILSENEIMILKESGFSFEILIDDMAKYYEERSRRTDTEMKNLEREMKEKFTTGGFGFGSMGGFYTYDEVAAELDSMVMLYPNLITAKYSIGTTLEGRTIWAVKISDNPNVNEPEPQIFYNSLIHAREGAGLMSVIYFMYYLLENYGSDPEVNYLVDSREMYFVPIINADGYVYNQLTNPGGGGMWRKNRKDVGNGCYGVDNNRNFGYMWGYDNIGSSPDPCAIDYRGTAAFSELENQAIRDFCNNHNFLIANNYHAYWDVVFTPWGYNLTQTPDSSIYNQTISLGTTFNEYLNGNFYVPGNYPTNGDVCDWMYGEHTTKPKIFAYLTEVGNDNDGFWPIPERIFPLAEENCYLNKVLAWGPGVIDDPPYILEAEIFPSYCKPQEDSIHITALESNAENYNSTVTTYLYDVEANLIDEYELSELDTNTYFYVRPVPVDENFYHLLLKDSGVQVPSNLYYKKDLKFTTAGPLAIDSVVCQKFLNNYYNIRPFVKNNGANLTITNAKIRIYCHDPWVISVSATNIPLNPIAPGATIAGNTLASIKYDTTSFPGYFNLRAEIMRDGFVYWRDSLQVIVTGVEVNELQLLTYDLQQNYPNPFNPSTKIGWQSPVSSQQSLKIYDILGNEIATLVDEYKPAGRYEVEFNAANLPSGVYFYQLLVSALQGKDGKAGDYVNSKKMILLK